MTTKRKKELIKEAKELNLYITENSNAINAARNLLEANARLLEVEAIASISDDKVRNVKLAEYLLKWEK